MSGRESGDKKNKQMTSGDTITSERARARSVGMIKKQRAWTSEELGCVCLSVVTDPAV